MTPDRLAKVLSIIRWQPATLAEAMGQPEGLVQDWLNGNSPIPTRMASWLEALCFTHEAATLLIPTLPLHETPATERQVPEHIPVYSYHLLRRLGEGPVKLHSLFGTDDEAAVFFLVSRGLAERTPDDLEITAAGRQVGHILT